MSIYTGDIHDDDAAVLEVHPNAVPPTPQEMPQVSGIHVPVDERPKRTTRLMTGTVQFNASVSTQAVQILWADASRIDLIIVIKSTTDTGAESITLCDDITKIGGAATTQLSASIQAGHDPIRLQGHTGPVYVAAEVGVTTVSWIAITA